MSVNAGVESGQGGTPTEPNGTEPVQPTGTPDGNVGGHPYDEYLNKLPESVRPYVEPVFQEWDKGVQQRFTQLQQQYDPWKPIIEGANPELAQQSLQLAQALEVQPAEVIRALAEAYEVPFGEPQQQPPIVQQPGTNGETPNGDENDDPFTDPRLQQHEEMLTTMGQYLLQQQQAQQQAQEDALLEQTLSKLHSEHGSFDDNYVLALVANGMEPAKAVQQFNTQLQQFLADQKAASAPTVVGSGGGVPSISVDPSTLDSKGTKNLVVELLKAAQQET